MTLKNEISIDEYFESLLDVSIQEHRKFLSDFKHRVLQKGTKNTNKPKGNQNKANASVLKPQNPPNGKSKESEKSRNGSQSKSNAKSTNEIANAPQTGAKKKTKFVSLYGDDGKMSDVIMLKGRHSCNCEASKHQLVNNCMQCGRVVCEQEGSGPCLFCGNLVCTEDELRIIESSSQSGENLKKSLLKQGRPKGWEEAVAMRNRLLDYDRTSEKRTTVIDDELDYFRTNSVWLSDEERARLKKLEDKMNEKKHASRRDQKITIDFTGRQIVEEPTLSSEFEDEIVREVTDTFAHSNQGLYDSGNSANVIFDNFNDCDPNLSVPLPIVSIIMPI